MISKIWKHLYIFSLILFSLHIATTNQLLTTRGQASNDVISIKCLDKERNALLRFKAHLQDPNNCLSTWTYGEQPTNDCCDWRGITCNEQTGHVLELELNGCGLKGEISHSLLNLTYLNYLDLSVNSFNGIIPVFIGSMAQLRLLDLSRSSFRGTIPWSIGSLTKLRDLDLSFNFFTGTIPKSIGLMTQLRYLRLDFNNFVGDLPPTLGNLTNLQQLSLRYLNSSTIENLDWLSHLSHLKDLKMDGTSLAKANNWVNVILGLQNLTFLSLDGCNLSHVMNPYTTTSVNSSSSSSIASLSLRDNNLNSSMYHWLFPLTSNVLWQLILSDNVLDGIPDYFGNLCGLTSLSFDNNSAIGRFSDFLGKLSGCTSGTLIELDASRNHLTGSLSSDIQNFPSLRYLGLVDNNLNGTISEKIWELPTLDILSISSNSLRGVISKSIGKSKLRTLDLSNNPLEGVQVLSNKDHMSNLSYIEYIDLSSCKLGPDFPHWIKTLKNLTHLDISNARISGTIPDEFWNMWPSRLTYLNVSSNNITGKLPDLLSNFDPVSSIIDLSSNNFYGLIPNVPSTLGTLNLSKNRLNGGISFLCKIVDGLLSFLDLSNNALTGQIPDCLWHFKDLKVLNLGHNNLFGRLPASMEALTELEVLYLYKNNFTGNLPLSLRNCTKLTFLDLGANNFSGNVPIWIGKNFLSLYILSLRSNKFFGNIPLELCELVNLQILDLSMNNLNGSIPSCVGNLTSMVQEGFAQNVHSFLDPTLVVSETYQTKFLPNYIGNAMIQWQGNTLEFNKNLGLLKNIDLSSNNLTGQIPDELTDLHELLALNLSNNVLLGEIPRQIGEMKKLLTLDLSRNKLSGELPASMSQMNLLNYLDVSHNNLSGRIPSSTQLQSFDPSRYKDNTRLCGPPVSKNCPEDEDLRVPPDFVGKNEDGREDTNELWKWFYIGGATGFATGFWIVCCALLINRRVRHAFFHFVNSLENWIYVKVVVFIANLAAKG
ncbi:hypothetical protein R6Q59_011818 [Mikania micrantha]